MKKVRNIAINGAAVTPSDTVNLPESGTLFIGSGGDIKVLLWQMKDTDTPLIFKNIPDGSDFPRLVKRVFATDTTATDIIVDIFPEL